ncbi:unnamed protein product [Hydatigera taeniaeformis]|uniref:Zf-Tim10_DDP domain-containing protein n=1 Tax=Hydatigena taeniaeformis TaxID=6205 RepID=A0A0R3WHV2_HYDTA|nr:unnamed protein product [Hydatigera taeniaeformis]
MQNRYTDAISSAIKEWDTKFLRKMQSIYFGCGKKCCDNKDFDTEQVQSCIEHCEKPVNAAQNLVQGELNQLQVHQCCFFAVFNFFSFISKWASSMETLVCVNKCIEEQITNAIPATVRLVSAQLQKIRAEQPSD